MQLEADLHQDVETTSIVLDEAKELKDRVKEKKIGLKLNLKRKNLNLRKRNHVLSQQVKRELTIRNLKEHKREELKELGSKEVENEKLREKIHTLESMYETLLEFAFNNDISMEESLIFQIKPGERPSD